MAAYGYERATKDVDFLVPAGPETVRALYRVMDGLKAVPARPEPRTADEALRKNARPISFNLSGWLIDFFTDDKFDAIRSQAARRRFGNRVIDVTSVRDLTRGRRNAEPSRISLTSKAQEREVARYCYTREGTGLNGFEPRLATPQPEPSIVCLVVHNFNDNDVPLAAIAHDRVEEPPERG